jgi:hypothetical protein
VTCALDCDDLMDVIDGFLDGWACAFVLKKNRKENIYLSINDDLIYKGRK